MLGNGCTFDISGYLISYALLLSSAKTMSSQVTNYNQINVTKSYGNLSGTQRLAFAATGHTSCIFEARYAHVRVYFRVEYEEKTFFITSKFCVNNIQKVLPHTSVSMLTQTGLLLHKYSLARIGFLNIPVRLNKMPSSNSIKSGDDSENEFLFML